MVVAELAVFEFPVASVNVAPVTDIDPDPDCVLAVGVNTTEYTVDDVVVSAPMVPPETVMSPTAKSVAASESVNVMVSVWPERSVPDPVRTSDTVGASVS
jgi:protoporphyrinogen oxidase